MSKRTAQGLSFLLLLAGLMLPAAEASAGEGDGRLSGRVVNRTAGGSQPGPVEVTLHTLADGTEKARNSVATGIQGSFEFLGLSTTPEYSYELSTSFQGVEYRSEPLSFGEGQTSQETELAVYDPSEIATGIQIDHAHAIVDADPESRHLRVMQVFSVLNTGDRTYVGTQNSGSAKGRSTLRFSIPAEATGMQASVDLAAVETTDETAQVAIASPIPPGYTEVVLSYGIAYQSPRLTLSVSSEYPTNKMDVFFADVGAKVSSPQLPNRDTFAMQDQRFLVLSGASLGAGAPLVLEFRDLPTGDNGGIDARWWSVVGVAAGATLAVAYPVLRRRQQAIRPPSRATAALDLEAERRDLLVALADLDDQFERGEITESSHRALRAQKKRGLMELLNEMQAISPRTRGRGASA